MQGDNFIKRFWSAIRPKPVLCSLFLAIILYSVVVITSLIWITIHSEDTVQRRIAQSPSVTVIIHRPDRPPHVADGDQTDTTDQAGDVIAQSPEAPAPASWSQENPQDDLAILATDNTENATIPHADSKEKEARPHWQTLARAFNHDDPRPRIALIMIDLGVTDKLSAQAIAQLPPDVTLAFQSVSPHIDMWMERSHKAGHENLLAIPMEPHLYPQNDPGPETLLTMLSASENAQRLQHGLKHTRYALGIIPAQGEKFVTDSKALTPVISTIKEQGLVFADATRVKNNAAPQLSALARLPYIQINHVIDVTQPRKSVQDTFTALEQEAKQHGQAVAIILPYPAAINQTKKWLDSFGEKNLLLAPVSALLSTPQADNKEKATETVKP